MKTAFAYARFSSDNQREESIAAQLRAIREYCSANNIRIVREYVDEAFSARTDKRPQFQEMFYDIQSENVDFVIVHKLDRFARNRADAAFYRAKLKQNSMKLVSVLERLDDTPESIILEGMLESLNEYYSANLSREVRKGLKENILNGKRNGGPPPFGYDSNGQHLTPNADAPTVKAIFEEYASGKPYKEMIQTFGKCKMTLYNILNNEAYIGHLKSGELRFENAHEPIISAELWAEVRKRMRDFAGNAANKAKVDYMLSRLLICGNCGGTIYGLLSKKKPYYTCRKRGCKYYRKEQLEKRVVNQLAEAFAPTDALKTRVWEIIDAKVNNTEEREKAKQARLKAEKRIEKLIYTIQYAETNSDAEQIMKQVNEIRRNMPALPEGPKKITREQTDAFCERFFDLKSKTPEEQRRIIRRAICKIVVFPDKLYLYTDLRGEVPFTVCGSELVDEK